MKTCFKCNETKPLSEFYRHPKMADGHLNKCKKCAKRDALRHREDNIDAVRAYDRNRGMLPHRVEARKTYQQTEAGKVAVSRAHRNYISKHPKRRAAQVVVGNAVRDGRLIPWPTCALPDCEAKPEAHHPDYDRPLQVEWLCRVHHRQAHALFRRLMEQTP